MQPAQAIEFRKGRHPDAGRGKTYIDGYYNVRFLGMKVRRTCIEMRDGFMKLLDTHVGHGLDSE